MTAGFPTGPERRPPGLEPIWTRHLRREVQYLLDLVVLLAAFALAYLLRFDFRLPPEYTTRALVQLPVVILLQFSIIFATGMYHFVWRYIGMAEIQTFLRATLYSIVPLLLLRFGLTDAWDQWRIPASIIVLDGILAFGGLLGLRVLRRGLYERFERRRRASAGGERSRRPVLLVGAGRAGVLAVREIQGRGDLDLDLVGFVDDDPLKQGSVIHGVKVLGTTRDLPELARRLRIENVVITIAEAAADTIRSIVEICERARLKVQIIPGLYEILQGRVSISRFRDVQIEDLLGRETVKLDEDEVRRFLTGKSVMVTGAGGSIGAELCRQIARFTPLELLLVERAEGALFDIDRELRHLWPQLRIVPLLADVGDRPRMSSLLDDHRPHVLLHAAAHKHVPMVEANPGEAIKNNVVATRDLARAAGEAGLDTFVLISTDKAVRPTSVMGASKRLAELVVQDLDRNYPRSRFLAVRFGNVMGSAGSVVPIFREQIKRGGPVTVTHPDVARYFMTIPEAAQLVLEAGALGGGGEIMVLDMGQPVKILDLAKDMIALSGYKPFEEIPIDFTGLRPGEKLFEELELKGEEIRRTRHPKIFVGKLNAHSGQDFDEAVARLAQLSDSGADAEIRATLAELLPEATLGPPSPTPPAAGTAAKLLN